MEGEIAMDVNGAVNEELVISRRKVIKPNLRHYKTPEHHGLLPNRIHNTRER